MDGWVWGIVGLSVFAPVVWGVLRAARLSALRYAAREQLRSPIPGSPRTAGYAAERAESIYRRQEMAALQAFTAARFAWEWATIDPDVVAAADFASTEEISNGFEFARHIHDHYRGLPPESASGFEDRLLGYVGEQEAANILIQDGHIVQMAETANQPVWDLIIDGHPANVKTVADIAAIKAEAAAHPDVTYIVPEDAHGEAGENIVRLDGFSHSSVEETVKTALDSAQGGDALGDVFDGLPMLTIAFAIHRNYRGVQLGKDPSYAVGHAAAEVIGRGGGGAIGAKIGGVAGSILGPVGMAAGALVGGIVGCLIGGFAAECMKRAPLNAAQEELARELDQFGRDFAGRLREILDYVSRPLTRMKRAHTLLCTSVQRRMTTWRWLLWPDFYTVLLDEAANQGAARIAEEEARIRHVQNIVNEAQATQRYAKVGALVYRSEMLRRAFNADSTKCHQIAQARERVVFERKQLNPALQLQRG